MVQTESLSPKRAGKQKPGSLQRYISKGNLFLDALFLPGLLFLVLFNILPMFGLGIAFVDFIPSKGIRGSEFVGFDNFAMLFSLPEIWQVIWNSLRIASLKIFFWFPVPILFAIMLNEVRNKTFKKTVQTFTYLPFFLSWIILAGLMSSVFSLDGVVNSLITLLGGDKIYFLGEPNAFLTLLIVSDIWKGFGWGSIIYLAALTSIDPTLYEAAVIDGANRWKQTVHITLPGIMGMIVLTGVLQLGNILNAGFDQIYNLYNSNVYSVADIIETYSFRMAFEGVPNYTLSTTIGLMKGVVNAVFILSGWHLAHKYSGYKVF